MNYDFNDDLFVSAYDCCPLWSANFGYTLLNAVEYRDNITALDIGTGTGFPAIELAERLGHNSFVYAMDIWEAALRRAELKAEQLGVKNIKFIKESVLHMSLADKTFDLITSNNCINNIDQHSAAISECFRVLKSGGKFIQVFNLPDTMKEFYDLYRELMTEKGMRHEIELLNKHIHIKRKSINEIKKTTEDAGFIIDEITEDSFVWPFASGTSLFNYSFIKMAFLPSWKDIIDNPCKDLFFAELEEKINIYSKLHRGIQLTVPYACIAAKKI